MANYRDTYFGNKPSDHGWYTCVRCGRKLRRSDMDKAEKFNADVEHWMYSYRNYDDEKLLKIERKDALVQRCAARKLLEERGYDF